MAKNELGTVLPRPRDIVGIDGTDLICIDGERIPKDLYEINQILGGGYTLVQVMPEKDTSDKQ